MTTFLTVDQLAQRVHRSPRTIQRWARERRIPHVKLGRATLFTEEQVTEIVAAYTVEPAEPAPEHVLPNPAYEEKAVIVSIDPKHRQPPAA
jgi:excisionase family DNA binding protein